jgi:ATP-dependent Clp protease ATP-binding subunit ClpC
MEPNSVSKLIGSPPGYVGYEENGGLTEKVRRKPYSVILFDEIEKAHPDIMNIMLQILDDGRLTDNIGRCVSFKNTVIIMTSNIGARQILNKKKLGFSEKTKQEEDYENLKKDVLKEVKLNFRPEFLNRIDEIIVFQKLNTEEMIKIAELMLKQVSERISKQGIDISFESSVKEFIINQLEDDNFGARPIRRLVQRLIEDRIVDEYLNGSLKEGMKAKVLVDKDIITFQII